MTAISGSCWDFTPFRVAENLLFSDVFLFGHASIDVNFSSIKAGPFLLKGCQPR